MKTDQAVRNEELIQRHLDGDTAASDALITENLPLVRVTVRRMLKRWPGHSHLREDLISEGVLELTSYVRYRLTAPLRPPKAFDNLVITIVRHAVLKVLQREEEPHSNTHFYPSVGLENLPDSVLAVEDARFQQIEDQEFLLSCCQGRRQREILQLCFDGIPIDGIAQRLRTTVDAVKMTLRRFRQRARRHTHKLVTP